jgi:hypothetical protein
VMTFRHVDTSHLFQFSTRKWMCSRTGIDR